MPLKANVISILLSLEMYTQIKQTTGSYGSFTRARVWHQVATTLLIYVAAQINSAKSGFWHLKFNSKSSTTNCSSKTNQSAAQ